MYLELHCHSHFSLLDGASSPETLVKRAVELGMDALALTDHDALYGALSFARAAKAFDITPIFGAELTFEGDTHLTLLVENATGWANLCDLITQARHHAPKGSAALPAAALDGRTDGLIALSGCAQGYVARSLLRGDWRSAWQMAGHYAEIFGREHFWIEMQHHWLPEDDSLVYKLAMLAKRLNLGCVATNNVHYALRRDHRLHDVLTCIRHGLTLEDASLLLRANSEYYLKSETEMRALFAEYPDAITNTRRIAERCHFTPQYGLQDLPAFPTPPDLDAGAYLRQISAVALRERFPDRPSPAVDLLDHELTIIIRSGLANYFLIVWDIVRFAREQGIRCQGRGSAANSLVAYVLGISPVNPLAHALVFERFLSDERRSAPDIDLDIQADRREEVIQYVYTRYGREHAAMACTLVTFREKLARREVGKVLGLSPEVIDAAERAPNSTLLPLPTSVQAQYDALCAQIRGLPRHLGIHNGGLILTASPLTHRVPTEPATMPGRTVVQWDKEALEEAGLVKIDLLGLRMLSAIASTVETVGRLTGSTPDLEHLSPDDPAVYAMIAEADTVGVFQVESRAQAQVLPRLRPNQLGDLIVSISLIRPGPVQGNMVHPYVRRRLGQEPVVYAHPLLEPALAETLGVILFQEQVLKVARDLGRLTAGQGELLRRALGGKAAAEQVERFHAAFVQGATQNGVSASTAEGVFAQLKAFGGYSFPKSHAAAFAVLVYQSAWLKRYHPQAFYTALLNHQPMGFWSPAVIVNDARRHGIPVLPVAIARSEAECTVEDGAIRLGFQYVAHLSEAHIATLIRARQHAPFTGLADLCKRVSLPFAALERLILVGALDGFGETRRQLLWALGELYGVQHPLDLPINPYAPDLPTFSRAETLRAEYLVLGLSTRDHPMALYRADLTARGILGSRAVNEAKHGAQVQVAGWVIVHQAPPTAKGHHFLTLEDEDGMLNVLLRPSVYAAYRSVLHGTALLIFDGTLQRSQGVVNVLAHRVMPLS